MSDGREAVPRLWAEAATMPHGPIRLALLDRAVALADAAGDVRLAYQAREHVMRTASLCGRPDATIAAFSWCLAEFDRDPAGYSAHNILNNYKVVIGGAREFPEIGLDALLGLLADMERRHREAGSTMHAAWALRRRLFQKVGDRRQAREAHARYRRCRPDWLSGGPAVVLGQDSSYQRSLGRWARFVQVAGPVLWGGLSSAKQPAITLGRALIPMLHLGRVDEAKELHRRGYALVAGREGFTQQKGDHLEFAALIGDLARARAIFERHAAAALATVSQEDRFDFLLAARVWVDRLIRDGTHRIKIRRIDGLPATEAGGTVDVGALGDWLTDQARPIARRFDARNGNAMFMTRIDDLPRRMKLAAG